MKKLFAVLVLSCLLVLFLQLQRYEIVGGGQGTAYKLDKLTGEVTYYHTRQALPAGKELDWGELLTILIVALLIALFVFKPASGYVKAVKDSLSDRFRERASPRRKKE